MTAVTGISAEEAANAFIKLSEALSNSRHSVSLAHAGKFRVKSEEIEIDWIS